MAMKLDNWTPDDETCDPTMNQWIIVSLMDTMSATQPDMAFASRVITRCNDHPTNEQMVAVTLLFQNLSATMFWQLHYRGAFSCALEQGSMRK
jgi:hypothetical protein